MIIDNFEPFSGRHCETTATGSLLNQLGFELSEPMLFGLGEGLGFIFWNMKMMDFPFIGGRTKPGAITEALARNLKLDLSVKETVSIKKAWQNVADNIDQDIAVGLQLDCYHLEYFGTKIYFAGHFVAMYGYDDDFAYLVDTQPDHGKVKTSLKNLELARSEKGPMAAKNLMYSLSKGSEDFDLGGAIITAISNNAKGYLNPPIKNFGYKGIHTTSVEIKKWFKRSTDVKTDFQTTAMLMEKAGTGGALFRNLYRDFLKESTEITGIDALDKAHLGFVECAKLWTEVASLFDRAGASGDMVHINEASEILDHLSKLEYETVGLLEGLGEH
ncbi:MAG: BtrH N-terminal domain-containing protein [Rhizobiaceae bacterium]|nr:BtrH N-terminal domain-containing protein [Rhizobiaceae bacterium]